MKNFLKMGITAALLCLAALNLPAQSLRATAQLGFTTGTTNADTALSYAIVSANSANGLAPVVEYVNAGSDLVTSKLTFYRVDYITSANYSNSTVTIPVSSTNGVGDNAGVIVIRHVTDDSYEKRILTTSTGSTNLVVTVAPIGTVVPGDLIYHCVTTAAGSVRWGASTNSVGPSSGSIYSGQAGLPLLIEINATTAGNVGIVSGRYR
jgi:hypothetical protein